MSTYILSQTDVKAVRGSNLLISGGPIPVWVKEALESGQIRLEGDNETVWIKHDGNPYRAGSVYLVQIPSSGHVVAVPFRAFEKLFTLYEQD